jgi:hypothetical protein
LRLQKLAQVSFLRHFRRRAKSHTENSFNQYVQMTLSKSVCQDSSKQCWCCQWCSIPTKLGNICSAPQLNFETVSSLGREGPAYLCSPGTRKRTF